MPWAGLPPPKGPVPLKRRVRNCCQLTFTTVFTSRLSPRASTSLLLTTESIPFAPIRDTLACISYLSFCKICIICVKIIFRQGCLWWRRGDSNSRVQQLLLRYQRYHFIYFSFTFSLSTCLSLVIEIFFGFRSSGTSLSR